ncbi:hypothetical protein [Candidatus Nitrosocosmicus hydrocola]|uniref:hypothetical protein n=1 Tax=Candidatus Nitrosocosmicus hydrocola TaxID=1826872 RepID=UPI0011E597D3|nr:hypothetical protein [Candidatus Nitrosocosmicus hydrocola]
MVTDLNEKMSGFGEKSPTVKTFEMFSEVKSPVKVITALDISPLEAEKLHLEYLRLEDRQMYTYF